MQDHWQPAYIGVGSNLDSPVSQVRRAIASIGKLPDTRLELTSSLYRSKPMGPADQPDFVNAVLAVLTKRSADELLADLHAIEQAAGRDRSVGHWGPRTLDLDLLAWSNLERGEARLTLPHPGIAVRNFVLLPWREIAPHVVIPGLGTVLELAARLPDEPQIERLV